MGLRKGDFCLAIQAERWFLALFPKEISICNAVCMPVPSNFSSSWLISTILETGQKSRKVIRFYKLAQVKISVGQRWFLVPLMGVTGDWVAARHRTWDSNQKLFREIGHFLFSCLQENIFSVCAWEGIVQGQSCCCTGTQFNANFSLSVLSFFFCEGKSVCERGFIWLKICSQWSQSILGLTEAEAPGQAVMCCCF